MKIMCIMTTIGYSGAPKMMAWLANSLSEKGHTVSLVTFYDDEDHQVLSKKINRIALNVSRANTKIEKFTHLLRIEKGIFRSIKKEKPDVVIAFSNLPSGLFLLLKKFCRVKTIISERGDPYLEKTKAMDWVRKQYRKADVVVFQTQGAEKYFEKQNLKHTAVIPNPVTQKPLVRCQIAERNHDISFVGRFNINQKRQDVFLSALKMVFQNYPKYTATLYGDGEDLERVKDYANELGISSKIHFPGQVDNICHVIRDSALFVISSDFEGIPNSLIDAMIAGLPVVATDCSPGGAALLVKNKQNGLLVPRGDSEALADGIMYMIENPGEADKYSMEAQNISNVFAPNKVVDLWEKVLDKVMGN